MDGFTKDVKFSPSRDWIKKEPSRNYGISTMRITFVLKGPLGAVQWMIGTEYAIEPIRKRISDPDEPRKPTGYDLGYHSPKPMYEGQTSQANCDILGCACFYDGSGLNADLLIEGFLARGSDWIWGQLREYYEHTFNGSAWPKFEFSYLPHPDDKKDIPLSKATP